MESIEERAKWYGYIVKERGDMPCELGESTYIEVATEQKKIDIEKACDAYCNLHCNADTRWMCRNNPISRCTTFEVFKKTMEE